MLKIEKSRLNELFNAISSDMPVYLPVKKENSSEYGVYTDGVETALDELNTAKSPKDLFFPQSETLAHFKMEGKNLEIIAPEIKSEQFVVYGVRACDAKSFDILDKVFLSDPVDEFYAAKRNQSIIITAACNEPEESCFCGVFGIDATVPGGDIASWEMGDNVYFKSETEKGA